MADKYALVSPEGIILEFRDYAPNVDQNLLAEGKPKMLVVEDVIPEYDPQVQELQKVYEVTKDKVTVKISSEIADAKIYYTIDGSKPT